MLDRYGLIDVEQKRLEESEKEFTKNNKRIEKIDDSRMFLGALYILHKNFYGKVSDLRREILSLKRNFNKLHEDRQEQSCAVLHDRIVRLEDRLNWLLEIKPKQDYYARKWE